MIEGLMMFASIVVVNKLVLRMINKTFNEWEDMENESY